MKLPKYAIFSIDNEDDVSAVLKFSTLWAKYRDEELIQCIGMYKGELENSFIGSTEDLQMMQSSFGPISGQESILVTEALIEGSEVYLFMLKTQELSLLGYLDKVEGRMPEGDWTYVPVLDTYLSVTPAIEEVPAALKEAQWLVKLLAEEDEPAIDAKFVKELDEKLDKYLKETFNA